MTRKQAEKKNILILTSTFPRWENDDVPGFVFSFAKHVKDKGWDSMVLAPHYPGAKKKENMEGIEVKRFKYWITKRGQNITYNGGAVSNLKKTPLYGLKVAGYTFAMLTVGLITSLKQKISVLNPHWLIPQGFIAVIIKYLTRKKVVVTVHGGDVFSLNGRILRAIKRWVLKKADEVVVNSSATLEAVQSLYSGREYRVIPMGIDTELFSASKTNKTQDDKLDILFVGRLSEEKGVVYLCQAIKQLITEGNNDVELTIAGSGPEEDKIKAFISENKLEDYIKMVGWVDPVELPDYYREADIFVGPSIVSDTGWQEAFGLVFAESLATGTPVIATKTGGIKDIVIDGENGFLVPDKNPTAITDKLGDVLNDKTLLTMMQIKAREHIINNFAWEAVIDKYDEVFSSSRVGGRHDI